MTLGQALDRLETALSALEKQEAESRENVCIEARSVLMIWMGLSRTRQEEVVTRLVQQSLSRAEELLRGQTDDCYQMVSKRLRRFLSLVDDPRRLRLPMQLLEGLENLNHAVKNGTQDVCLKAKMVLDAWEANRRWCLGKSEAELLRDVFLEAQPFFQDGSPQLRNDVESTLESILDEYGFNVSTAAT